MAVKKETYTEAMKRLEDIVSRIESDELDIDQLRENLREAQKLVKYCRDKLYKADEEIKRMLEAEGKKKKKVTDKIGICKYKAYFCPRHVRKR